MPAHRTEAQKAARREQRRLNRELSEQKETAIMVDDPPAIRTRKPRRTKAEMVASRDEDHEAFRPDWKRLAMIAGGVVIVAVLLRAVRKTNEDLSVLDALKGVVDGMEQNTAETNENFQKIERRLIALERARLAEREARVAT